VPQPNREELFKEGILRGPFVGICSELSLDQTGDSSGFVDCFNMMLVKSQAWTRRGVTPVSTPTAVSGIARVYGGGTFPPFGVADVLMGQNLYKYNGGTSFTTITGPNFNPGGYPFCWATINKTLCFSHADDGVQNIQGWVINAATYSALSASAPNALCLMEFDNRLVAGNVVFYPGPILFNNRIYYTNSNDATDWTSVNSGFYTISGDLGPIFALSRIYQLGYVFSMFGISQIQLTGNGLSPFYISPFGSKGKGVLFPFTFAPYGEEGAAYVGSENVFFFDGTESVPIGDRPIEGSHFKGAWSSILIDLSNMNVLKSPTGIILTSLGSIPYKTYWLSIPGQSTWIYNFKEQNWTRFQYNLGAGSGNILYIGPIRQNVNSILDDVGICSDDSFINFSAETTSIEIGQTWSITSGQIPFMDLRRNKYVNRFRFCYTDFIPNTKVTVTFTNEKGVTQTVPITFGTGIHRQAVYVVPITISGVMLQWSISGTRDYPVNFSQFSTYYEECGEYKNT
jgi:hypothetical protein